MHCTSYQTLEPLVEEPKVSAYVYVNIECTKKSGTLHFLSIADFQ